MTADPHPWAKEFSTLYDHAWHRLIRGVHDGHAPAHKPTPDAAAFAVVHLDIRLMDLLHLGPQHRRAQFDRDDGWAGHWVAP